MSFFSYKNSDSCACPGQIVGEATNGLSERVCIQVNKVYDSCMQQTQLESVLLDLTNITPPNTDFIAPLCFISSRSTHNKGCIRNLCIDRLEDRPNFARVQADIDIPVEVLFVDAKGKQGKGFSVITVKKDVILFVPCESVVPFMVDAMVSSICVTGSYRGDFSFVVTTCVTVILKILAEVELVVPSYGFCNIPPCEEFAENVCDEFFSLPIFPQEMGNGGGCCGS